MDVDMTILEKRIKLLEFMGWTDFNHNGNCLRGTDKDGRKNQHCPNPFTNLNYVREMLLALTPEKRGTFTCMLIQNGVDKNYDFMVASAEQKAEILYKFIYE